MTAADSTVASFSPALFAGPEDSNHDGQFTFPSAANSHPFWGGGFCVGTTYLVSETVAAGFSYTSPQWFETWQFNSKTDTDQALTVQTPFMLPMIYSMGASYP